MGLRTLRRALNLAYAWGVRKGGLSEGENQRDRVLSTDELERSLESCKTRQPSLRTKECGGAKCCVATADFREDLWSR
jgi:hypothetical protein